MGTLKNVSDFHISGSRGIKDMEIDKIADRTL